MAGFRLGLSLADFWLDFRLDFGFWLSFTRISAGFDLIWLGFRVDSGWIRLGFLHFRSLLLGFVYHF